MKVIAVNYSLTHKILVAKIVVIYVVLDLLIYLTSSLKMIATINKSITLTIFNLFDLVFLEFFRVLGVAQGVKSTTGVLLLLRVFLHATLVLNKAIERNLITKMVGRVPHGTGFPKYVAWPPGIAAHS